MTEVLEFGMLLVKDKLLYLKIFLRFLFFVSIKKYWHRKGMLQYYTKIYDEIDSLVLFYSFYENIWWNWLFSAFLLFFYFHDFMITLKMTSLTC